MWILKFSCSYGSSSDGQFLCTKESGVSFGCGFWKGGVEVCSIGSDSGTGIHGITGLQSDMADQTGGFTGSGSNVGQYSEYSGTGCDQLSGNEVLGNAGIGKDSVMEIKYAKEK